MTTTTQMAVGTTLALGSGPATRGPRATRERARRLVAVKDFAEASERYRAYVEREEDAGRGGASRVPPGTVYEVRGDDVRAVATVSYNGKIWPQGAWTPGMQPLFDPSVKRGAL
jgi:hypothetical protein